MKRILVYYNNGYFESTDINDFGTTLLHILEIGVAKLIVDTQDEIAWIKDNEGTAKKIKIPEITGLD